MGDGKDADGFVGGGVVDAGGVAVSERCIRRYNFASLDKCGGIDAGVAVASDGAAGVCRLWVVFDQAGTGGV